MSNVADSLRTILSELNISQIDFAKSVGASFGYINMVVNGRRKSVSRQLALLIQEKYGYSADWILHNEGDKNNFPFKCKEVFEKIRTMLDQLSPEDMNCLYEFILALEEEEKMRDSNRNLKKQMS
jgi:transcriptional regulator with XRE-family HTH domain